MAHAKYITWNGMTKNMTEWAAHFGISGPTFRQRLNAGVPFEDMSRRRGHSGGKPVLVTYEGVTRNLADWAEHFGLTRATMYGRHKRGVPFDKITETPTWENNGKARYHTWNGMTMNMAGWARYFGITYEAMYYRLKRGIPFENVGDPIATRHKGRPKGLKDKKPRKVRFDRESRKNNGKREVR